MAVLQDMTQDQLIAMVQKLQSARQSKLTIKVSAKGAISIYGFGKWPVTLYRSQMERLMAAKDEVMAFIDANEDLLATKD